MEWTVGLVLMVLDDGAVVLHRACRGAVVGGSRYSSTNAAESRLSWFGTVQGTEQGLTGVGSGSRQRRERGHGRGLMAETWPRLKQRRVRIMVHGEDGLRALVFVTTLVLGSTSWAVRVACSGRGQSRSRAAVEVTGLRVVGGKGRGRDPGCC